MFVSSTTLMQSSSSQYTSAWLSVGRYAANCHSALLSKERQSGWFFSMVTCSPASSCVALLASHSFCAWRRWSASKPIRNNNGQAILIVHQNGVSSKACLSKKLFSRNMQTVSTSFSLDTTDRTLCIFTTHMVVFALLTPRCVQRRWRITNCLPIPRAEEEKGFLCHFRWETWKCTHHCCITS